jgi:hypothetical protein
MFITIFAISVHRTLEIVIREGRRSGEVLEAWIANIVAG